MSPSERTFLFPNQHCLSYKVTTRLSILTCLHQRTEKRRRLLQNRTSGVQSGRSVASRCRPESTAPANATLIAQKNECRLLGAAGFQRKSFAEALTYLPQLPRCRHGNAWFFGYFFFFVFFFALGTEITCRSNVAITGLILPTATKFCPL